MKNDITARLKDSHLRIFGNHSVKKYRFSIDKAQEIRSRELRGRNYDFVTFKNNKLQIKK